MPREEKKWELRLYVAGKTPKSVTALNNLKKYCETPFKRYLLDIRSDRPPCYNHNWPKGTRYLPSLLWYEKCPNLYRKIIGDLSNEEKVLVGLDIRPVKQK